jgi:hypothetical protein
VSALQDKHMMLKVITAVLIFGTAWLWWYYDFFKAE